MAGIAQPVWKVEVSWSAVNGGAFIIDTSQLDGAATLSVSAFDDAFGGTYDNVSSLVDDCTIQQGASDDLTLMAEGACTITLRDRTALFNPENAASPLYADLAARLHPVRVQATLAGTVYRQFYGWVRRFRHEPVNDRGGRTILECVDLFYWLNRTYPVIASTGATTTGAAISLVLDACGWTDPLMRSLAAGDSISDFSADGSKTAASLIQELLDFERGRFFVSGSGVATYEHRNQRAVKSSAGTLANEMRMIGPGVDADRVRTKVTVQRTGGVAQTAADTALELQWGPSNGPTITSGYLASDAAALDLANYILSQLKSAKAPVRSVDFDGRTSALLTQLLGRGLSDKLTVSDLSTGTSGTYFLEQRRLRFTSKSRLVEGSWTVSKAPTATPFILDTNQLDGVAVLSY